MNRSVNIKLNPRMVFWKCGACSHAMFHLLNHEFDNVKPQEEKASDMLAGGIAQKGHQCGMLWGGALAIGTESFRRYSDKNMAVAAAINASKLLVDSFHKLQIKGLSENINYHQPCFSCSTEVVKKMGSTDEESIMVAGLAGGIGLSGHACGALGAAIWYKMLDWGKKNPGKSPSMFNNQDAKDVLRTFNIQTDSEMLCKNICNKNFITIDEHSDYIKSGGCKNLIEALAKA